MALEEVDEENGCLWVVPGSNHESVYPPDHRINRIIHAIDAFSDLNPVHHISHFDDEVNTLSQVVNNYPPRISVMMPVDKKQE